MYARDNVATADLRPDQSYTLEPVGAYYEIRARHSGKLLTVSGGSAADGAPILQWTDQNLPVRTVATAARIRSRSQVWAGSVS